MTLTIPTVDLPCERSARLARAAYLDEDGVELWSVETGVLVLHAGELVSLGAR